METHLKIEDFEIDFDDIIGEGSWATVYGCKKEGSEEKLVAKVMKELDPNFENEVTNLARVCALSSDNIVKYIKHFYLRKEQRQILITEYCDNTLSGLLA